MHTPGTLVLNSGTKSQCEDMKEIAKEISLGHESKWGVYFDFDDSAGSRIPSQWDRSGKALSALQDLPPSGDTHRHVDWYEKSCLGGREMTDLEWRSLRIFLTRAADIGLIPMYDLMNHHNGLINTILEADGKGGLSVIASTAIARGEPIYNTYARSGWESSIDVFNTYGFVEDFPQLWRWSDDYLEQISTEDDRHANHRYGMLGGNDDPTNRVIHEPNTHHHEVLVVTPTLVALLPTKQLVETLGNAQRSLDDWQTLIEAHHAHVRSSHARALGDAANAVLDGVATTIEEDEVLAKKNRDEQVAKLGGVEADVAQAIEYRLAFKRALKLTVESSQTTSFMIDSDEL